MTSTRSARAYIRHPYGIPVGIVSAVAGVWERSTLHKLRFSDLSCGFGKYFGVRHRYQCVKTPQVKPPFEAYGKVV